MTIEILGNLSIVTGESSLTIAPLDMEEFKEDVGHPDYHKEFKDEDIFDMGGTFCLIGNGWNLVKVGLTEGLVVASSDDITFSVDGEIDRIDQCFWHSGYERRSMVESIIEDGFVSLIRVN